MTAAIALVCLYLLLRNYFRKPRKDVQDEPQRATPLSSDVFYLED